MTSLHGRPCDADGCDSRLDPGAVVWVDIDGDDLGYYCSDRCRRAARGWPDLPQIAEHLEQVYGLTPVSTAWLRKVGAVA